MDEFNKKLAILKDKQIDEVLRDIKDLLKDEGFKGTDYFDVNLDRIIEDLFIDLLYRKGE